ncbi:Ubiquinone biosynthesis hydroxylase, UbiH/UbiF/VisC/COQ6 family [Thalassoporum mexicanum PCC 7367]|uniref:FAD-dependent monooxygenase n=1 Tax=Thalassoporum mexicanum TaxID=3457544 RepID=UPI00029FEE84|nr:FAD-dependent monooxygenase [Pseudanabaena sp. PCC 7367]AFY71170.1 Ubiquinone biosynthesis hydroxylase, UbiH/UbiF/VisC/COQ6 family [Pseudanabaena sp. PCC 7367]
MFDVLIVGGGMVGASLACALGNKHNKFNQNLKVGLVEARSGLKAGQFGADGRASAIALGSSLIWQNIGVWDGMVDRGVTAMQCIQISDGDYPHKVKLWQRDVERDALGYVVENKVTLASLWQFMADCDNIELICPAKILDLDQPTPAKDSDRIRVKVSTDQGQGEQHLSAKLLVAADGGRSLIRSLAQIDTSQKTYDQTCIVVTLKAEHSHQNIAYERFQHSGPFAILPLEGDRLCIVWTATTAETPYLLNLPEAEFMAELKKRIGDRLVNQLGELTLESCDRAAYVPRWMHAKTYIQPRLALVGDAAHSTHPVAGQGMNLGIRDVGALAETLINAQNRGEDLGSMTVLNRYQNRRRWDNLGVILLTDITNRLFSNQFAPLQWLRRLGLLILASLKPLRQLVMLVMMGLIVRQPRLGDRES